MTDTVHVFFSTNRKYLPFCGIAIYSMLSNASAAYKYDIRILHSGLKETEFLNITGLASSNTKITPVDVTEYAKGQGYYNGVTEYTSHITEETFYRLLIPELFSELERVVYLDCDLIVLSNIAELYQVDLQGKTIGAVYSVEQWCEGNTGRLPNNDPHEWFNAGVMVFDIQRYKQKGYVQKARELLAENVFDVGDQELLRLVCYQDVTYLPFAWNVMWHHLNNGGGGIRDYNRQIYTDIVSNPKIIHYSGSIKPWNRPKAVLAEHFWHYAKEAGYYDMLTSRIEVSVVIPMYNAHERINVCMESLWKQTFPFFEILCIDDGSDDDTVELVKKWQERDSRIQCVQQIHQGAGAARNRGLKAAKGKYVYFMDADDFLSLDAIEGMYRKAEEKSTDVLFFNAFQFDANGREKELGVTKEEFLPAAQVFSGRDVKEHVFALSYGYVWTKLYRREYLQKQKLLFQEIFIAEALSFVYLSMMLADRIGYWDARPIHYYMDNPAGQSMHSNTYPLSVCMAWLDLKHQMESRHIYKDFEHAFINKAAEHCMDRFNVLSEMDAVEELFDALKMTYFDKLGIADKADEYFSYAFVAERKNTIMSSDLQTFIFQEYLKNRRAYRSILHSHGEISYSYIPRGCRIILYGAGKRGKSFHERIKRESYCDIVLWVDKTPHSAEVVCKPRYIVEQGVRFDYVLLAVKEKMVAEEIKAELRELGINEDVIVWHP